MMAAAKAIPTTLQGARARRGALKPKRKRTRGDGRQPSQRQAAEPPQSGRKGPTPARTLTPIRAGKSTAESVSATMRIVAAAERPTIVGKAAGDDDGAGWQALAESLYASADKLRGGDMADVEDMLLHQAFALQSLFVRLSEGALAAETIPSYDLKFRYALRAQSQCRATLETLATIKNPPVLFARQANVTTGPQQINNGGVPSRAREKVSEPNKLSGATNELPQDTRAPALAIGADPTLAPVGTLDGTTDGSRES